MKDQPMKKIRSLAIAGLFVLSVTTALAATLAENFTSDPAADGWQVFGDTNLFQWDSTNQNLAVTWDSSQPNSYFYHPLGTILTRNDDFSIAFDLQLNDAEAGGYGFEIAISLLNFADATNAVLERGVGVDPVYGAQNVTELDYFPDAGFGATISPTMISSNNQFASAFDYPLELASGVLFHVVMTYTAGSQTLSTAITNENDGQPFGPIDDVQLDTNFTDVRLDTVAVSSYSDTNSYGSVLVHGTVANLVVTVPPPPVQGLSGSLSNGQWQVQFISRTHWLYTLQQTADFQSWSDVSLPASGSGTNLFLQDTHAPADRGFYRVRADRP
jgi:hypothetical protein